MCRAIRVARRFTSCGPVMCPQAKMPTSTTITESQCIADASTGPVFGRAPWWHCVIPALARGQPLGESEMKYDRVAHMNAGRERAAECRDEGGSTVTVYP